ncbi:MAG: hypothetical protein WBD99_06140 [Thermodesulfobacteriota bacterium]
MLIRMVNNEKHLINSEELDYLKKLVIQHKVCREVWPEYLIDKNGNRVQIGFELDLTGIHYHPVHHPTPGCDECVKVYNDLKKIAQWIVPTEERESKYDIGIFDRSIHSAPIRKLRDEVTLTLKIVHRTGFDRPVDACEVECLKEMEEKLKELGVKKGQWRDSAKDSEN